MPFQDPASDNFPTGFNRILLILIGFGGDLIGLRSDRARIFKILLWDRFTWMLSSPQCLHHDQKFGLWPSLKKSFRSYKID
jgi:hypothetical protein